MNDKELLELAAKAYGIKLVTWGKPVKFAIKDSSPLQMWNPLVDDGAALRLAVRLNMTVAGAIARTDVGECTEFHLWVADPYAATRHAITRAAAEIGKGITQELNGQSLPEDNYYKT